MKAGNLSFNHKNGRPVDGLRPSENDLFPAGSQLTVVFITKLFKSTKSRNSDESSVLYSLSSRTAHHSSIGPTIDDGVP